MFGGALGDRVSPAHSNVTGLATEHNRLPVGLTFGVASRIYYRSVVGAAVASGVMSNRPAAARKKGLPRRGGSGRNASPPVTRSRISDKDQPARFDARLPIMFSGSCAYIALSTGKAALGCRAEHNRSLNIEAGLDLLSR
jgi:hypothetical protein